MPKVNKIQSSFSAGEVSKQAYGRVDNPRYEQGLVYCQNYLPLIQGPLTRRPGTKYVSFVKDSTKLPVLIPFQFSANQTYMLEMGDLYIRFYANEGQVIVGTSLYSVHGRYSQTGNVALNQFDFHAIRSTANVSQTEIIYATSVISTGAVLELYSPYQWQDIKQVKYVQKQDTIYLAHPAYPPWKIVRTGFNTWDMKQVAFQDGPYLPLNSYKTIADNANTSLNFLQYISPKYTLDGSSQVTGNLTYGSSTAIIETGPKFNIWSINSQVGSSQFTVEISGSTGFVPGTQVVIGGATGNTNIVNVGTYTTGSSVNPNWSFITQSSAGLASWTVDSIGGIGANGGLLHVLKNSVPVLSANLSIAGSSGTIQPALFQLVTGSSGQYWADVKQASSYTQLGVFSSQQQCLRPMGIYFGGQRYYGWIGYVYNAAQFLFTSALTQGVPQGSSISWNMGVYNYLNGFPSTLAFHQDRLVFGGVPSYPQEIDGSMTGIYETFSASGSNAIVSNNNAIQINLSSNDINQIKWLLSAPLGLLAGTQAGEWAVTPSTQNAALSPTNVKADQVTAFGCADIQAIFVGNAALYVQRAQRKVRELLYYWQVGNFRSTNLSELSQHITVPSISKIVSVKEPNAFVWALRADGNLLSLTYNRDDITLQANSGWARHVLGGRSDASASVPIVNSIAAIPSGDTTWDELWMVTQRYLNGSTIGCIEYMSKPFDDYQPQETSVHLDCAGTYASSIVVTGLTIAGSCVVTAPNHGLSNSSTIRFYNTIGMNISSTDVNGLVNSSNPFNYQTFVANSVSTNAFFIQDFNGNYINTNSCSVYVGSAVINKLITSISGITWLAGETISVVADGGIHVNTTVSQAGVLNLAYAAAKVNFGYAYNSDAQMLRTHEGSAQGTSIGATRRTNRVAFMLHNVGDFAFGASFTKLIPMALYSADANMADNAPPLFDGIIRDGLESEPSFEDSVCWRQSSGLPGMVQAVTRFIEEQDV